MFIVNDAGVALANGADGKLDVTFTPNWVGLLVGVVLPILVGLVTKTVTSASAKATLLLFLSAVNGFVTEYINSVASNVDFHWSTALYTWGGSFAIAVATHFGFYTKTGVTAWAQRNLVR